MEDEYDRDSFMKIGQTLDMPGEIEKSILIRVPKKSWIKDKRRQFFIENANSQKYYYMPIGDIPQHPYRNTLVPLGTFLGFDDYRPAPGGYGKIPITDTNKYYMRFSNPPYNSETGHIGMNIDPLVYTENHSIDGSNLLTYQDYIEQIEKGEIRM
jgi:hypothetical protein